MRVFFRVVPCLPWLRLRRAGPHPWAGFAAVADHSDRLSQIAGMNHRAPLSLLCLWLLAWPAAWADEKAVSFMRDVRPILTKHCFACHGPDEKHREANLRLDQAESALAAREGRRPVVPGKPESSEVIRRVTSADASVRMPPADAGQPLAAEQIDVLRRWIAEGARWERHWSFEKLARPTPPTVRAAAWPRSDLDRFVLARLEKEGLAPSPAADPHTLIRRVSLDLTGLPPDPEMVRRFAADPSPQAYERIVDELLGSRHFGERWARLWLDLARYADTKGYEKDLGRTMWRYRDWVIEAFNADMPLRPVHARAAGRRPVAQSHDRAASGHGLPPQHDDQRRRWHRRRGVPRGRRQGPRRYHAAGLDGPDDRLRQVPQPQVRPDRAPRVLPALRLLQSDRGRRRRRRGGRSFPRRPRSSAASRRVLQAKVRELEQRLTAESPELRPPQRRSRRELAGRAGWIAGQAERDGSRQRLVAEGSRTTARSWPRPRVRPRRRTRSPSPLGCRRFTGLRLEALPDKSHPRGGVGRSPGDGNFVLSGSRSRSARPTAS